MKLTDLLPIEKWIELEKAINERSSMNASIFNANGVRITTYKKWANQVCPEVKATDKGQSFICAVAHTNLANEAKRTRKLVFEECDAGFVKLVVPIFVGDDFLGAVGGCGLLLNGSEVDVFAIHKITDIETKRIESLCSDVRFTSEDSVIALGDYISERIRKLTRNKE